MATPQAGVFALETRAHRHLEFDLTGGVESEGDLAALRDALCSVVNPGGTRHVAVEPAGPTGASVVVGLSPRVWTALAARAAVAVPADQAEFPDLPGVPRQQHDLWVWVHGNDDGDLFDTERSVSAALSGVAKLVGSHAGFVYHDSRDLSGFIDGTENPDPEELPAAVVIAEGMPGAGGMHAIVQRWVHDLDAFHQLGIAEQESIIGRRKPDSVEIGPDERLPSAHISRVVIDDEAGDEMELFRRSVPFGNAEEAGLIFVGFGPDSIRFERMLARMFGVGTDPRDDDGIHDRLTEFSTPVSGSGYFVPSQTELDAAVQ